MGECLFVYVCFLFVVCLSFVLDYYYHHFNLFYFTLFLWGCVCACVGGVCLFL